MATFTSNYGLHQWAPEDNFLRTDFNTDLQKIDTALGQKAEGTDLEMVRALVQERSQAICGTYTGDGSTANHILLDSYPVAVIMPWGMYCYVIVRDYPNNGLTLMEDGFLVSHDPENTRTMNKAGATYEYLALL